MKFLKNKKIILIIIVIILLAILGFILFAKGTKDFDSKLAKTKSVVVSVMASGVEKNITDSKEIKEIVKIIQDRKPMTDENIPYRDVPHYKLKMLDRKKSEIVKIDFFYYDEDTNYVRFNDEFYKIDADSLLKIIE